MKSKQESEIRLRLNAMKNLGLVLFFIVAGLFLQGCDSVAFYSFSIKSKESSSVKMDDKKVEIIKVVEPILIQQGFSKTPDHVEGVTLNMYKYPSDRHGDVYISVTCENNIIKISTAEWGVNWITHRMSDFAWNLQKEIADKLNQPLKDCCIITKDDKYSGRK